VRIWLDFTRDPDIGEMFDMTIPMLITPVTFTPLPDADLIVSDGIELVTNALEQGKYAIHYCFDATEPHPADWKQSPRYRYVQHDAGAGGPVTGMCVLTIAGETGTARQKRLF
jgi:hypothetical protein